MDGRERIDSTTKAAGHPSGVQARGAQRTWTEGSESAHNNSPRAPLRCTSEGCPAHMDGRAKSIQQQKLQGTPQVYKRGVPSAHGRKGANQFTIIAPGHPSGVQARGTQRTCRKSIPCGSRSGRARSPAAALVRVAPQSTQSATANKPRGLLRRRESAELANLPRTDREPHGMDFLHVRWVPLACTPEGCPAAFVVESLSPFRPCAPGNPFRAAHDPCGASLRARRFLDAESGLLVC